jgi:bifunctional DNA-binding transcriptional regulator/antitoxin component of YhaV-PrlF toxin-antitoxin module
MSNESRVSKGYLTVVPKRIRRAANIAEGDRLAWSLEGGRIVVAPRRARSLKDVTALISHGGNSVTSKRRAQRGVD